MIALFQKTAASEPAAVVQHDGQAVFASLEAFRAYLDSADQGHAYDQLVIVGSKSDIAWVHAALPETAMRHITAEIEYPLLPGWFKQPLPLSTLTYTLGRLCAD